MAPDGNLVPPVPIAIVGMGCRFPGGVQSPSALWNVLVDNQDVIGSVPPQRWADYAARGPDFAGAVRRAIGAGGYLEDIAGFDADVFGISPREAELMDPQQRVTLEVAWESLEHAGIAPSALAGSDTAVFMGVCTDDYGRRVLEDLPRLEAWSGIGASMCAVANRVSHALDLRGPSVVVDTACSASLVAVHQACQSLRAGETSVALAGGVMLVASPAYALALDAAGALSPDGTSKAFDAAANGYVRSEGCAVLTLKRLDDALRDGDRVHAVLRGSAVCQDGRTNGIMAPSGAAQARLVGLACANAGVAPGSVDYVEAHGTGTGVGDPIEVSALAATVGQDRLDGQPCLIGSVKTNIGHLEAASGVAGIIKVVLALGHEQLPATLARDGLNPAIPWAESGLAVVTENTAWPRRADRPRRAGVGNYGYGGTLAHVVVEEAPAPAGDRTPDGTGPRLFPLSGTTTEALRANASRLAAWLSDAAAPLDAVGATLAFGRAGLDVRACVVAADRDELAERLGSVARGRGGAGIVTGQVLRGAVSPHPVWVFSGHGAQWAGMGADLLATEPVLGETLDELAEIFAKELGFTPRQALADGELGDVGQIQALIFALQVGLSRVWRAHGVTPAAIIGHSVGEVAAAVAAGMLDLPDAARLICRRSALLRRVAGRGGMVLVNLPFAEVDRRVRGAAGAAIAAAPRSTVVSGDVAVVEDLARRWRAEGLTVRRVDSDVAFHSPHMDELVGDLRTALDGLTARPARVPVYSTALADPRSAAPRDAAYWATNLRAPVRFADAVAAAVADGHRLFVEVSAHPVVAHSVMETLAEVGVDGVVVPTLRRGQGDRETLLDRLGTLHCLGVPVDLGHRAHERAELPATAWQHRRYWVSSRPTSAGGGHDVEGHTVLGRHVAVQGASPVSLWQTRVDTASRPYPGGHQVLGSEVLPAAVVLTTFLAAGGDALTDVVLRSPVAVTLPREVQVVLQDGELRLSSRLADQPSDHSWLVNSSARVAPPGARPAPLTPLLAEVLDPGCVLERLTDIGVVGIGFPWRVTEVHRAAEHLRARIAADPDDAMPVTTWGSLFDAALSAAPVLFPGEPRLRMPGALREVRVYGAPPAEALAGIDLRAVTAAGDAEVDVTIAGPDGEVLASLTGVRFAVVHHARTPATTEPSTADLSWRALPPSELAAHVETLVRQAIAVELRTDPDALNPYRPLTELGVDSLLGESIRQRLVRGVGTPLPSGLLWDRPNVASLRDHLTSLVTDDQNRAA
ncbi:hypothetical protein BLA60_37020 [Actinophytocola xinjiangensis]|uniref:Acyl transferase domain-containing protein n=1 Tax=Actinophytocola xinjiangensis TaxID=485602 RepID=A0A7Z0WFB6_9PSEU|nr:type I polyketide synthase [Actinophytocola xinjiangensis]OLF05260.1 hypothetical protein BLA60_37020 [Actinophytocola xinjiangensis]